MAKLNINTDNNRSLEWDNDFIEDDPSYNNSRKDDEENGDSLRYYSVKINNWIPEFATLLLVCGSTTPDLGIISEKAVVSLETDEFLVQMPNSVNDMQEETYPRGMVAVIMPDCEPQLWLINNEGSLFMWKLHKRHEKATEENSDTTVEVSKVKLELHLDESIKTEPKQLHDKVIEKDKINVSVKSVEDIRNKNSNLLKDSSAENNNNEKSTKIDETIENIKIKQEEKLYILKTINPSPNINNNDHNEVVVAINSSLKDVYACIINEFTSFSFVPPKLPSFTESDCTDKINALQKEINSLCNSNATPSLLDELVENVIKSAAEVSKLQQLLQMDNSKQQTSRMYQIGLTLEHKKETLEALLNINDTVCNDKERNGDVSVHSVHKVIQNLDGCIQSLHTRAKIAEIVIKSLLSEIRTDSNISSVGVTKKETVEPFDFSEFVVSLKEVLEMEDENSKERNRKLDERLNSIKICSATITRPKLKVEPLPVENTLINEKVDYKPDKLLVESSFAFAFEEKKKPQSQIDNIPFSSPTSANEGVPIEKTAVALDKEEKTEKDLTIPENPQSKTEITVDKIKESTIELDFKSDKKFLNLGATLTAKNDPFKEKSNISNEINVFEELKEERTKDAIPFDLSEITATIDNSQGETIAEHIIPKHKEKEEIKSQSLLRADSPSNDMDFNESLTLDEIPKPQSPFVIKSAALSGSVFGINSNNTIASQQAPASNNSFSVAFKESSLNFPSQPKMTPNFGFSSFSTPASQNFQQPSSFQQSQTQQQEQQQQPTFGQTSSLQQPLFGQSSFGTTSILSSSLPQTFGSSSNSAQSSAFSSFATAGASFASLSSQQSPNDSAKKNLPASFTQFRA